MPGGLAALLDDVAAIASGPSVPDPTPGIDLSGVVRTLGPELPAAAARLLLSPEPPGPRPAGSGCPSS